MGDASCGHPTGVGLGMCTLDVHFGACLWIIVESMGDLVWPCLAGVWMFWAVPCFRLAVVVTQVMLSFYSYAKVAKGGPCPNTAKSKVLFLRMTTVEPN